MPTICDACEKFICACDIDLPTRAELVEALTYLASTASRIPIHWTDRKAAIHKQIDKRLTELEAMDR